MASADRLVDGLTLFLTGGASNTDPALSLGGIPSSVRVRGMGVQITNPIQAIRVDNVYPACGEGDGTLTIDANESLVFTPPGGSAGTPVAIAEGTSKIVAGLDVDQAIRVYRVAGGNYEVGRTMNLLFVNAMNGVFGQSNLTSAQRVAGRTTYRCLALRALDTLYGVTTILLWTPAVSGAQAAFSLAVEDPVAGAVQTIANETTAPSGVSWSSPTTEGVALRIDAISPNNFKGLWIRRVFPAAGTVAAREGFQLAMTYKGV